MGHGQSGLHDVADRLSVRDAPAHDGVHVLVMEGSRRDP